VRSSEWNGVFELRCSYAMWVSECARRFLCCGIRNFEWYVESVKEQLQLSLMAAIMERLVVKLGYDG